MKTSRQKFTVRATLSLGLLAGLCAGLPAVADDARTDASASCSEETRRVVVWPTGGNPKSAQMGRSEERAVTVCDGKVVFQPLRNASTGARR